MTAVDWSRFRKCPVCFARLGEPCMDRVEVVAGGLVSSLGHLEAAKPHGGRKLRAGYSRG